MKIVFYEIYIKKEFITNIKIYNYILFIYILIFNLININK